jgi:hypothetical protein
MASQVRTPKGHPLEQIMLVCVELIGGWTATAEWCDVSRATVHRWVRVPDDHALRVGEHPAVRKAGITVFEMRPDVFGSTLEEFLERIDAKLKVR